MNEQELKKKTDITKNKKDIPVEQSSNDTRYRIKAAAFLAIIGSFGLAAGFGGAVATVKKQDPSSFDHGPTPTKIVYQVYQNKYNKVKTRRGLSLKIQQSSAQLHEGGAALAGRALAYGSLWAVFGCSVLFFSVWKLMGAKDLKEFRVKAGSILPRIPKNEPPVGRTEFSGTNDFLRYLIEEDKKKHATNEKKN